MFLQQKVRFALTANASTDEGVQVGGESPLAGQKQTERRSPGAKISLQKFIRKAPGALELLLFEERVPAIDSVS
jgi:hypothetical protein